MKRIIKFTTVLFILLVAIFGITNIVLYSGLFGILSPFNITNVSKKQDTTFIINFDKVKSATKYELVITDINKVKVYDDFVTDNNLELNFNDITENMVYELSVIAYNKAGKTKESNNNYSFKYIKSPSLTTDDIVLSDEGALVYLNGDISNKKYRLKLTKKTFNDSNELTSTNVLLDEIYTDDVYELASESDTNTHAIYTFELINNNVTISTLNLYYKVNPLEEPTIISPANESNVDFTDLKLSFKNIENAEKYDVTIYNNKNQSIFNTSVYTNELLLDKSLFTPNVLFYISVKAVKGEYSLESKVKFIFNNNFINPVYINRSTTVNKGDKIELLSDDDASIYYTVDGTDPLTNGSLYNEPIEINDNTTIKAYSIINNSTSLTNTFDIKVGNKNSKKVFLYSSNQVNNVGVDPFTNERFEMSEVADVIEKELTKKGMTVIRNNYLIDEDLSIESAIKNNCDLFLSIGSNSSYLHENSGLSSYIYDYGTSYGLSHLLLDNLYSIYNGEISEDIKTTFGLSSTTNKLLNVKLSLGYHDNEMDAKWIMENKEKIGKNIASSVLSYYGL